MCCRERAYETKMAAFGARVAEGGTQDIVTCGVYVVVSLAIAFLSCMKFYMEDFKNATFLKPIIADFL